MDANTLVGKAFAMMTLDQKKKTAHDLNESLQALIDLIHDEDPVFSLE